MWAHGLRLPDSAVWWPSLASDLALRRWLDGEQVPLALIGDEPFTRPARPRLVLGGRHLILQTTLVSFAAAIQAPPRRSLITPSRRRLRFSLPRLTRPGSRGRSSCLRPFPGTGNPRPHRAREGHDIRPPGPSPRFASRTRHGSALRTTDLGVVTVSSPPGAGISSCRESFPPMFCGAPGPRLTPPPGFSRRLSIPSSLSTHSNVLRGRSSPAPKSHLPLGGSSLESGGNLWLYGIETLLLGWSASESFGPHRPATPRRGPPPNLVHPPGEAFPIRGEPTSCRFRPCSNTYARHRHHHPRITTTVALFSDTGYPSATGPRSLPSPGVGIWPSRA